MKLNPFWLFFKYRSRGYEHLCHSSQEFSQMFLRFKTTSSILNFPGLLLLLLLLLVFFCFLFFLLGCCRTNTAKPICIIPNSIWWSIPYRTCYTSQSVNLLSANVSWFFRIHVLFPFPVPPAAFICAQVFKLGRTANRHVLEQKL